MQKQTREIIIFRFRATASRKQSDPLAISSQWPLQRNFERGKFVIFVLSHRALRIISTFAHRRFVDGRIRALIKLMQLRALHPQPFTSHCRRINLHVYRVGWLLCEVHTLETVPPCANRKFELPLAFYKHVSRRLVRRKMLGQFWSHFFSAGERGRAILSRFWRQKNTQHPCVARISTNIIRRRGWRAAPPGRLSRCVIRISAKSLTRTRWQSDNKSLAVTLMFSTVKMW